MRFRLLRRRLTISAPRVAVRNALPWPVRWMVLALAFGFCAAIALWAFEFGKTIAGLDRGSQEEISDLRGQLLKLREERDQARRVADTSQTLLTAEKATQAQMLSRNRQLEADNQGLRDDLGFFEKLIPPTGEAITIRGLQAEIGEDRRLRWRILLIQPQKNVADFQGSLDVTFSGVLDGKPWTMRLPEGVRSIQFRQFGRFQGLVDVPPQVIVRSVSARVTEGSAVRATQSAPI